ncbi:hypothetical protein M422DRAFT_268467 [Sphaerobolus stellatus SS14]|uniref:Uncharacterized protein n=1 Tax=Sphaerobolus stellatus (strain SS14) TaxID=990650 RepID=A0A0C9U6V3_SPHS4|nr:hypothetical protein M422DRAFT_268467 [Sphaerobolus stellatus SS14]
MVSSAAPHLQRPKPRKEAPKLSTVERKLNAEKAWKKEEVMQDDVDELLDHLNKKIKELSAKHSKKEDYFLTRLHLTSKADKQTRKESPYNAYLHALAEKENGDLPPGSKSPLMSLVQSGAKKYCELTKEEKEVLVKELETYREGKEKGFRVTTKARAQVVQHTRQIVTEMVSGH